MDWVAMASINKQDLTWTEIELMGPASLGDVLAVILQDVGCNGSWFDAAGEDVRVRGYLAEDMTDWLLDRIQQALAQVAQANELPPGALSVTTKPCVTMNWASGWKKHYSLLPIGSRFVIVPSWLEQEATGTQRIPLLLDPGMAFGTGLHPTTQLALEFLERSVVPGDVVYDVGCGSGILSIAACKIGARRVIAVDNDLVAVVEARENVARNGIEDERCSVIHGKFPAVPGGCADVVIMNILAEVIIANGAALKRTVTPGGLFIAGGITTAQQQSVITALGAVGFRLLDIGEKEEWTGMIYKNG
ncbi:MAG: 50S ribosomal protein L11 methyltransferase [Limnochordia bacterium]|jgi:ribosomal protein L11 methyltransferase|nr:50S ribosomal protein L11 methyltransferase [Limnochordia bacterium]MDD2628731.1 50S ribosomal protein L11 methyltransferase [Limnochordia bacterium]MDD4517153.1 50S ribosomal protein L11 methyltransferase [Limnochordia bacterium]